MGVAFAQMPSGRQRKDERLRRFPPHLASDLSPASLRGWLQKSRLRVLARALSLGRRGERLTVAVGTPPGPGPAHDSGHQAGAATRTTAFGGLRKRHLSLE